MIELIEDGAVIYPGTADYCTLQMANGDRVEVHTRKLQQLIRREVVVLFDDGVYRRR